jgi:hypothetical protein
MRRTQTSELNTMPAAGLDARPREVPVVLAGTQGRGLLDPGRGGFSSPGAGCKGGALRTKNSRRPNG